ncbi:pathogenesis-related protein 1-like protein [Cinnamomum micranthum f. kanehirae]|uniref:Pathogenesis-related protein 1-like protein n=1 Tax=Cinnamomum micranthum f. kanehirae TaxID=337451 RepID=A0A443ND85_9MAGN|nr:pathogenesis-related protein 1-like protein [Cinnamomum micranthum f. kanehirae]
MVKGSFTEEKESVLPPSRLWKAGIRDALNLLPKIMPEVIASYQLLQGDGGVGSIRQLNFTLAFEAFTYVKDRVDIMDDEKHVFKYTVIEGGEIGNKLKSYSSEIQFQATSSGGCLSKMTVEYDTINDSLLPEEEVTKMMEGIMWMGKAMEAYLQANPDAYV